MNEEKRKIISDICPFYKEYGSCEQCNTELDMDDPPCYFECMANAIIQNDYRKQSEGEWMKSKSGLYVCSVCDKTCPYDAQADDISYWECNFCPNCGAKMKGGAE